MRNKKTPKIHTQHLLYDIIAITILHQRQQMLRKCLEQIPFLFGGAFFQDALNDATSVQMRTQRQYAAQHLDHREIHYCGWNQGETILDHVVPVRVHRTSHHFALQTVDNRRFLVWRRFFDGLLHHPAAIHIGRQQPYRFSDEIEQKQFMFFRADFEEFLHHKIGGRIGAQVEQLHVQLVEHGILAGDRCIAEFLLDELGATIMAREFVHMARNIAEAQIRMTIGNKILEEM